MISINIFKNDKFYSYNSIDKIKNISHNKDISNMWIDLYNCNEQEIISILGKEFNFHPLAIEDTLVYSEHPKLDIYKNSLFCIIHSASYKRKTQKISTWEIDLFLGKNFLVTTHMKPVKAVETMKNFLSKNTHIMEKGADFLFYKIIDLIIDNYFPILDSFDSKISEIESEILIKLEDDTLQDILLLKKNILLLKKILYPQLTIISDFSKRDYKYLSNNLKVYFNDVLDHIEKMDTMLSLYNDIVSSDLNINLSITSYKTNEIMKTLTVITTIMMPLTLITGIYGMNFVNMPELHLKYGYFVVLGVMVLLAFLMILYFNVKKWFK